MLRRICIVAAVLLGSGALVNGMSMLASPAAWYFAVPGVTTTGPFNQHFLRDIGIIFLFVGGAYLAGAARPDCRIALWAGATLWLCSHATFHVWEVAVGICGAAVLIRDFPAVSLPALVGASLTLWAIRSSRKPLRSDGVGTSRTDSASSEWRRIR